MTEEKPPEHTKKILLPLLIAIVILAVPFVMIFSKIEQQLLTKEPEKRLPSVPEKNNPANNDAKKIDSPQQSPISENKIPVEKNNKSTLTWVEFGERLKTVEKKRQEVFNALEKKFPNYSKQHYLLIEEMTLENPIEEINDDGERKSWGKVIQNWQKLNEQQRQLSSTAQ